MGLSREERAGLTMWGESMSAQFRGGELAVSVFGKPDVDGARLVLGPDVEKLLELLKEGERRGEIHGPSA